MIIFRSTSVAEVWRNSRDCPISFANGCSLRQKLRQLPVVNLFLSELALGKQLTSPRLEVAGKFVEERGSFGGQNLSFGCTAGRRKSTHEF
jgi:hypothetical protein